MDIAPYRVTGRDAPHKNAPTGVLGVTSLHRRTHYPDADIRSAGVNSFWRFPCVVPLSCRLSWRWSSPAIVKDLPDLPGGGTPPPLSEDEDAPVRALYLCANRFILINAHPFPVRVTWRVQGTDEQGEQTLAAAPDGDPGLTEVEVSARHQGPLELYRDATLLAVRANEQLACEPTTGPAFAAASSGSAGSWTSPVPWPLVAIHLHLLWTGKVLAWGTGRRSLRLRPGERQLQVGAGRGQHLLLRPRLPAGRAPARGRRPHQRRSRPARRPPVQSRHPGVVAAPPTCATGAGIPTVTELPNGQVLAWPARTRTAST